MGLTGHSYGSLMMCCQHIPNCTLFRCWVCLWADHCCNGSSRNGQFRSSGLQLLGAGLVLVFVLIVHVWIIVSVSGMRVWAQEVLCGHCWVNHWTMKIAGSGNFVVSSSPPPPSSSSPPLPPPPPLLPPPPPPLPPPPPPLPPPPPPLPLPLPPPSPPSPTLLSSCASFYCCTVPLFRLSQAAMHLISQHLMSYVCTMYVHPHTPLHTLPALIGSGQVTTPQLQCSTLTTSKVHKGNEQEDLLT